MPNFDGPQIIGIIGTILIVGLILKDNQGFDNVMNGLNTTLTTLEKAG
jgi:Trk-type K+ transport system membrane component